MLSVKYVFLIWQETNGGIVILKTVLKSDLWPGSEKCGFNPKLEDNDLKSGCYRVPKLPPLSVNYVCPISHETNHPIMIPKIVLKSVLWRGSESALNFWIFQLLCFSLHPSVHEYIPIWILCGQYLLWDVDDPRRPDQQVHDDRRLWLCPQELPAGMHARCTWSLGRKTIRMSHIYANRRWILDGTLQFQITGAPWLGLSSHLVGDRHLSRPWLLPVP